MDAEEARTIGRRVKQVRYARGKSLRVLAGLAGISKDTLSRIERGERALDSRSEIAALANALDVAPSELTVLDVGIPSTANGDMGASVKAVRRALRAVSRNQLNGQVLPAEVLRTRAHQLLWAGRECRQAEVGTALPALIQDLHTTIAAGRDVAELLEVAVVLHTQGTQSWLKVMCESVDLRSEATLLARQAAERREEPTALGVAMFGEALVALAEGEFDLALHELDSVTVPTNSPESMQLAGMLALCHSLVDSAARHLANVDAALEYAGELAEHTGQGNAYFMGFGPTNVGLWRMAATLEIGDYERAATIAESLNPVHVNNSRQAAYWVDYGRATARLRGRQNDAVIAFRRAETISPLHMLRNPFARDVLAELLAHAKRDAVGRELRGMAYRAGLPL